MNAGITDQYFIPLHVQHQAIPKQKQHTNNSMFQEELHTNDSMFQVSKKNRDVMIHKNSKLDYYLHSTQRIKAEIKD